jgi:hypothetical protein
MKVAQKRAQWRAFVSAMLYRCSSRTISRELHWPLQITNAGWSDNLVKRRKEKTAKGKCIQKEPKPSWYSHLPFSILRLPFPSFCDIAQARRYFAWSVPPRSATSRELGDILRRVYLRVLLLAGLDGGRSRSSSVWTIRIVPSSSLRTSYSNTSNL